MDDDDHATLDELAAWHLGGLTPARRQAVEAHLARGCTDCAAQLEWVRRTVESARAKRLVAPPAEVLLRAKAIFARRAADRSFDETGRRSLGRLIFDSLRSPQPAGLRGAADAGRQLLYAADELAIEVDMRVEIEVPERRCHLTAQVLEAPEGVDTPVAMEAQVEMPDGIRVPGTVYPTGEITVSYPQAGPCTLLVSIGEVELALPILEP